MAEIFISQTLSNIPKSSGIVITFLPLFYGSGRVVVEGHTAQESDRLGFSPASTVHEL